MRKSPVDFFYGAKGEGDEVKFSEGAGLFSLVFGAVAVWFLDAKLQLDELLGGAGPWIGGLVVMGTVYGGLIQTRAHENQADR